MQRLFYAKFPFTNTGICIPSFWIPVMVRSTLSLMKSMVVMETFQKYKIGSMIPQGNEKWLFLFIFQNDLSSL